ncbi:AAA family ATPase [Thiothrix lacustris]|uniref:AAA family ATPase n=1 Tax=Thiothrix lacustris TaxID=525917 RepID=A0ABY9MPF0_9GAMM|nr:AAA family ATPase [Thiothrix lacustris]WML89255.1 AAA family ATPase [Thiothrix lacustris]
MKLKQLTLENFRGFKKLELALDPQLTVLVGANGAGKSSVLDALAILLSWVVARVRRAGGSGRAISEMDIHNRAGHAVIKIEAADANSLYWQLVKGKAGHVRSDFVTTLDKLSEYAKTIQQQITDTDEHCSIPLFAYYPVNRAVLDIPLRIRTSHEFGLLDAWDEALTSASNFRSFFEWFRNQEDLENELERYFHYEAFCEGCNDEPRRKIKLPVVRSALEAFLPDFTNFSVRRSPLRMIVNKHGQEVRVDQLSDGEKCLIALVADLARRLAIANPPLKNPLEGEGVVLIDEVDLHLHPGWQRMVLPKLITTFPNCQFIVSTHSPQILGEVEASQIRILTQDENNDIHYSIPQQAKGLTSNEVLDELMNIPDGLETLSRNAGVEKQLDTLFRLIDDEQFEQAKIEITRMKTELHGDIPDIVRAEALMTMLSAESEDEAA